MITTISQLLEEIKHKGINEISPHLDCGHSPTIGDMYEGLTKEILQKTIFSGLDLRVVSGKIKNIDGHYSKQIDCMIVVGDGIKLPFTDTYTYLPENVIAVIEVKKNLFSSDLSSAYDNLKSAANLTIDTSKPNIDLFYDAYKSISGQPLPEPNDLQKHSLTMQHLYHALLIESGMPLRVVFGYGGFADEMSLRNKFIEYLENKISASQSYVEGFGVTSLPDLIICKENTLIKTSGMPYALPAINPDEKFCWIASYHRNSLLIFLELLWTRLTYKFNISSNIFGDDLQMESLAPLLYASISTQNGRNGWSYSYDEPIHRINDEEEWSPCIISDTEHAILGLLCDRHEVIINEDLKKFVEKNGESLNSIIEHLSNARIIYIENQEIKLLTKQLQCAVLPEIGACAADNHNGQFTNWLTKHVSNKQ